MPHRYIWLSLAVWLLAFSSAKAATVTRAELPAAYQACRPRCFVSTTSEVDIGNMSVFQFREFGSNPQSGYLLRYSVYAVARTPLNSTITQAGYLWLRASSFYDLSESHHALTLYTDHMDLPPNSQWGRDADPLDWDFSVSTDALLGGGGHYINTCCSDPAGDSTVIPLSDPHFSGEPPHTGGPIVCAADGCQARGQLNFVYFLYQAGQDDPNVARLVFDPARANSLVYGQAASFDGDMDPEYAWFSEQNFHVAPVPLPPAFLLRLSGLGTFSWVRGRDARLSIQTPQGIA